MIKKFIDIYHERRNYRKNEMYTGTYRAKKKQNI